MSIYGKTERSSNQAASPADWHLTKYKNSDCENNSHRIKTNRQSTENAPEEIWKMEINVINAVNSALSTWAKFWQLIGYLFNFYAVV